MVNKLDIVITALIKTGSTTGGFGTMKKINELYDETEEGCSASSKAVW